MKIDALCQCGATFNGDNGVVGDEYSDQRLERMFDSWNHLHSLGRCQHAAAVASGTPLAPITECASGGLIPTNDRSADTV